MSPLAAFLLLVSNVCVRGAAEVDPRYDDKDLLYAKFPDSFLWGSATSSYQVEGAYDVGGRTPSIWDTFSKTPGKTRDGSNGDIACDSYHKYNEDIKLMKDMGVKHYRYSISWSRVMADGTNATYLPQGMAYYNNLTRALRDNGIEPLVTLYHWDLPQVLQDRGGWLNDSIVELFEEYARTCYRELGDQVKWWLTFNEPWVFCNLGYNYGSHAPGWTDPQGVNAYKCAHNVIRSHARAYRVYNQTFRPSQKGKVSITLNIDHKDPYDSSNEADQAAAYRAVQFTGGWFANAIYKDGDYPEVMRSVIAYRSLRQNLTASRLPQFTEEEKRLNRGSYDYFGLNHYSTGLIRFKQFDNIADNSYDADQGIDSFTDPSWMRANSSWLYVVPWGLRKLLRFIRDEYNNPDVIITENGVSHNSASINDLLNDQPRIQYYQGYINNVLKAIVKDNCSVIGYTAWSLMDNFEWAEGYTERFGLHYVNFTDPDRKRTPKKSVAYLTQLIRDNAFLDPNTTTTAPWTTEPPPGPTTTSGGPTTTSGGPTTTSGGPTKTSGGPTTTSGGPTTTSGGPTIRIAHALWPVAAAMALARGLGRFSFALL